MKQLQIRNEEYLSVYARANAFFDSVLLRISSFNYDLVHVDRLEESRTTMDNWKEKAEVDRRTILRLLKRTYDTQVTEMTSVRVALQRLAVEWDSEFSSFEKRIFPSDKDVRRLTALQLKRLFTDSTPTSRPISPDRRSMVSTSSTLSTAHEAEEPNGALISDRPRLEDKISSLITEADVGTKEVMVQSLSALAPFDSTPAETDENESDSTVYGGHRSTVAYPSMTDQNTSEAESEMEPGQPRTPGRGVANLVNFFSDSAHHSPSTLNKASPARSIRNRPPRRSEAFSDGGTTGYAANVGVSHLAHRQALADQSSRIPHRVSRLGTSGATKVSVTSETIDSLNQIAAEGSNETIQSTGTAGSTKGKSKSNGASSPVKQRSAGGFSEKGLTASRLKLDRPTASSIGKASIPRRIALPHRPLSSSRVSTIAQHFNERAKESDRQSRLNMSRRRVRPVADAVPKVQGESM